MAPFIEEETQSNWNSYIKILLGLKYLNLRD